MPGQLLAILSWSSLLLACTAVELSPTPSVRLSNPSSCPRTVYFTCTSRESYSEVMWWQLNGDTVALSPLSANYTYPLPLEVPERFLAHGGVSVSLNWVKINGGGSYMWASTLTLNVLPGRLIPNSNVTCGDGVTKNTSTIRCQLPRVSPFLQSPLNASCDAQGNATFFCRPPSADYEVTWEVSGSSIGASDVTQATLYQLQVNGCRDDWSGTIVQCVAKQGSTKVFSGRANLNVDANPAVEQFLINEEQEIFAFLVGVAATALVGLGCGIVCCTVSCMVSKKPKAQALVQLEDFSATSSLSLTPDNRRVSLQFEESVSMEQKRNEQRRTEIKVERGVVLGVMKTTLGNVVEDDMTECGSRLQKYSINTVTSVAVKPPNCAINLALKQDNLNRFLEGLKHPNVQRISSMKDANSEDRQDSKSIDFVVVTQPVWGVALRDLICGENFPFKDWASKYGEGGSPLISRQISLFGVQILQAVQFLYSHHFEGISLRPLGQIQSGNIYIRGEQCKLGGYDNTLLGYRSTDYQKIAANGSLDYIDVIMFGYVVYEMGSGNMVKDVTPTDEEYSKVRDVKCETLLRYIFTRKERNKSAFKHTIAEIMKHQFFKDQPRQGERGFLGKLRGHLHTGKHTLTKSLDSGDEDQRYLVSREDEDQ